MQKEEFHSIVVLMQQELSMKFLDVNKAMLELENFCKEVIPNLTVENISRNEFGLFSEDEDIISIEMLETTEVEKMIKIFKDQVVSVDQLEKEWVSYHIGAVNNDYLSFKNEKGLTFAYHFCRQSGWEFFLEEDCIKNYDHKMKSSYFTDTLRNQDGQQYGTAYFLFPVQEGFPISADPERDFDFDSNDIWDQTLILNFDSLWEAKAYQRIYQTGLNEEDWKIYSSIDDEYMQKYLKKCVCFVYQNDAKNEKKRKFQMCGNNQKQRFAADIFLLKKYLAKQPVWNLNPEKWGEIPTKQVFSQTEVE